MVTILVGKLNFLPTSIQFELYVIRKQQLDRQQQDNFVRLASKNLAYLKLSDKCPNFLF